MPHLDEHGKPQPGPEPIKTTGAKIAKVASMLAIQKSGYVDAKTFEDVVSQRDMLRVALSLLIDAVDQDPAVVLGRSKRFAEKVLADTVPK